MATKTRRIRKMHAFKIPVDSLDETVKLMELKLKYMAKISVKRDAVWVFNRRMLQDDEKLKEHNISYGDTLILMDEEVARKNGYDLALPVKEEKML